MKERPIIMQAESVRAILDGRQTQMRRVVAGAIGNWHAGQCGVGDPGPAHLNIGGRAYKCPHGQPGDRLWVRETWTGFVQEEGGARDKWVTPSGGSSEWRKNHGAVCLSYKADDKHLGPWKSPLFMPRWASRITLELVNVRVERVQDISGPDIWAEGMTKEQYEAAPGDYAWYRDRWQSIHRKNPARCWEANPWVWVLEFKRVDA